MNNIYILRVTNITWPDTDVVSAKPGQFNVIFYSKPAHVANTDEYILRRLVSEVGIAPTNWSYKWQVIRAGSARYQLQRLMATVSNNLTQLLIRYHSTRMNSYAEEYNRTLAVAESVCDVYNVVLDGHFDPVLLSR